MDASPKSGEAERSASPHAPSAERRGSSPRKTAIQGKTGTAGELKANTFRARKEPWRGPQRSPAFWNKEQNEPCARLTGGARHENTQLHADPCSRRVGSRS